MKHSVTHSQALLQQIEFPQSDLSETERNSLLVDTAFISTPSLELIEKLEYFIAQREETTDFLLVYGAVVANAAPEYKERMVKFLTDKFPDNTSNNTEVVIHILHALGNTNSSLAVSYIIQYLWHTNEAVRLTAVSALRFFTSLAAVQDEFLHMMDTFRSVDLINEIIATLQEGCKNQDTIVFSESLLQALANNTIILGNPDFQMDLIEFLNMLGSPEALDLVESIEKQSDDIAREKRGTTNWSSTSSIYSKLCPASERANDVRNYPTYRSYLWYKTVGKYYGTYKFYARGVGGAFAGVSRDRNVKVSGKNVIYTHILGQERDIVKVLVSYERGSRKVYMKFGSRVLYDSESYVGTRYRQSYSLPRYEITLLSFYYPFVVYGVTLYLGISVDVGVGGSATVSASVGPRGQISADPLAYASVDVSLSLSLAVSNLLPIICIL